MTEPTKKQDMFFLSKYADGMKGRFILLNNGTWETEENEACKGNEQLFTQRQLTAKLKELHAAPTAKTESYFIHGTTNWMTGKEMNHAKN